MNKNDILSEEILPMLKSITLESENQILKNRLAEHIKNLINSYKDVPKYFQQGACFELDYTIKKNKIELVRNKISLDKIIELSKYDTEIWLENKKAFHNKFKNRIKFLQAIFNYSTIESKEKILGHCQCLIKYLQNKEQHQNMAKYIDINKSYT